MISRMEEEELEACSQNLQHQRSEEKKSMRENLKEEGVSSQNEEEEEDEVPVASDGPVGDNSSLLAQPALDLQETCESVQGSSGWNGGHNTRVPVGMPVQKKHPWGSRHSRLDSHRIGATPPGFFDCPDCGKRFTLSSHLIRHQRVHTGEKLFGCRSCTKSFSQRSDLVRHERTHTGVKLYRCAQCGKSFSESSHLIWHQIIHSGEKPFQCSVCGKCYGDSSYLMVHQRAHTGARPYCCARCGKSFGRSSTLIRHQACPWGCHPGPWRQATPTGHLDRLCLLARGQGGLGMHPGSPGVTAVGWVLFRVVHVAAASAAAASYESTVHEDYGMAVGVRINLSMIGRKRLAITTVICS